MNFRPAHWGVEPDRVEKNPCFRSLLQWRLLSLASTMLANIIRQEYPVRGKKTGIDWKSRAA